MVDTYVCIDLETTGLNPKKDKIIEIGGVKVVEGKVVDTFSTFVNPGRQLEKRIVELTGILDDDLEQAPYIEEVFPRLEMFLGDLPLVGHSLIFDYSFLKKAAVDYNRMFEKRGIDTLKIARKCLSELPHKNLDYLCEHYQIMFRAHRALEDAKATSLLYQRLLENFFEKEERLFQLEQLNYAVKKDTPATSQQKQRLYKLIEKHKIEWDRDIEKMTRSEASRFTDKIFLEFGR